MENPQAALLNLTSTRASNSSKTPHSVHHRTSRPQKEYGGEESQVKNDELIHAVKHQVLKKMGAFEKSTNEDLQDFKSRAWYKFECMGDDIKEVQENWKVGEQRLYELQNELTEIRAQMRAMQDTMAGARDVQQAPSGQPIHIEELDLTDEKTHEGTSPGSTKKTKDETAIRNGGGFNANAEMQQRKLRDMIEELEQKLDRKEKEADDLRRLNMSLHEHGASKDSVITTLKSSNERQREELRQLRQENDMLNTELGSMRTLVATKGAEVEKTKEDCERQLKKKDAEIEKMKENFEGQLGTKDEDMEKLKDVYDRRLKHVGNFLTNASRTLTSPAEVVSLLDDDETPRSENTRDEGKPELEGSDIRQRKRPRLSSNIWEQPELTLCPSLPSSPEIRPVTGYNVPERAPDTLHIMIHNKGHYHQPHPEVKLAASRAISESEDIISKLGNKYQPALFFNSARQNGNWTCFVCLTKRKRSEWPKEGGPGNYACQFCTNSRRACILLLDGQRHVLPLAPSLRIAVRPNQKEFCILPESREKIDGHFFSARPDLEEENTVAANISSRRGGNGS